MNFAPFANLSGPQSTGLTITQIISATTFSTWVAPTNVTSVFVECWGPGGNGGRATRSVRSLFGRTVGGGGGGGGAYASGNVVVIPGISYTLYVGPSSATNTYFQRTGFGPVVLAVCGSDGEDASGANNGYGARGLGGLASSCIGSTTLNGSNGTQALSTRGGNGGNGLGDYAGTGGSGYNTNGNFVFGNGGSGTVYGAGGGGGAKNDTTSTTAQGGSGSQGIIRLTYVIL